MPECFVCGEHLARGEGSRRKVEIGERRSRSRKTFALFPSRHYVSKQYGPRTVCSNCAAEIDEREEAERKANVRLTVMIVGFFVAIVSMCIVSSCVNRLNDRKGQSDFGSNPTHDKAKQSTKSTGK